MINYLHFISDFWFSSGAKLVEWISKLLSIGTTMALTKNRFVNEELELGLGVVRFTRGLGRKRILISSSVRESLSRSAVEIPVTESSSPVKIPMKRQRSRAVVSSEKSRLESLPQELLNKVIEGVDHDDLINLYLVSKSIKEASLIAKSSHFAFTTPKKIRAFRNPIDIEDSSHLQEDLEPPNAPKHYRWTEAKRKEQLSSVTVALFT